jgi:ATP-binding cassette subfamily C exporter for protease/lipase
VYNNPAFIVLDEPNANLDDAGEFALVKAINALRTQGQTTVIISHRPTLLGVVNGVLLLTMALYRSLVPAIRFLPICVRPTY